MLQQGLFDNAKYSEMLEVMDNFFKENSSDYKKLELHKERIEKYLKKIDKLVSAMENAKTEASAKMLQDKMDAYGKEIKELQKQVTVLEESCQRNYTTKDVKYIIDNFQKILMESSREQETVDFIRSYLHGVTLGADYMEIELSDSVSEEEEQAVA